MSFTDLAHALNEAPETPLIRLVEEWPGLAMLARGDGTVIAAADAWAGIGITPHDLRLHGWFAFVQEDDNEATRAEVVAMSGEHGRPAQRFRNTYVSRDGSTRTLLEWTAGPFGTADVTLALATIVRSEGPPVPGVPQIETTQTRLEAVEAVIRDRARDQWRRAFSSNVGVVSRWVATIQGEILFSEGGGYEVDAFRGLRMGVDFGSNPEFFAAVGHFSVNPEADHFVQFAQGAEDNPDYAGQQFLNSYSLIRTPSGRPNAVAVVSIQLDSVALQGLQCVLRNATCDQVEGAPNAADEDR